MRIRILVIDDEESVCDILKFNLEKDGYEVDCAYSAEGGPSKRPVQLLHFYCRHNDGTP